MATIYTQQQRPWTFRETADTNALSVRALREGRNGVNNLKNYVSTWQVHDFTNAAVISNADEVYFCQWGPLPLAEPFMSAASGIRCEWYGHRATANNVTVRVYSFYFPYTGATIVTAAEWGGIPSGPISATTSGGTNAFYSGLLTGLVPYDINSPAVYLVMTVDGGAAEDGFILLTFDAWLEPVT